ncbi:haloacetate dehalogenase [Bradyrhizobium sp. USDA 3311]|nr:MULTISPECIES: alpha/beta hydrolase [unclassified Bradyrhizobium]
MRSRSCCLILDPEAVRSGYHVHLADPRSPLRCWSLRTCNPEHRRASWTFSRSWNRRQGKIRCPNRPFPQLQRRNRAKRRDNLQSVPSDLTKDRARKPLTPGMTSVTTIRRATCRANGIRQFYLEAGAGPPIVLLHGFPETSFAWRFQIPALAPHYRVIAPDLRGYGETDKPPNGYDKRTMANDIVELLKTLGVGRVALIGHDRGARVATRLVKDHPDLVDRLVVMDNVPTRIVAREMTAKVAREYWFFMFHQIPDLPEALIAGREDIWLRHFFSDWCHDPMTISGEAFETYVKSYSAPGAVRGAMSDYRASAEDIAQDLEDAEQKIRCPVLSLWGEDFGAVGRLFDMKAVWSEMAETLSVAPIERCGHLPQEEQPEAVNKLLLDFLKGWNG